MSISEQDSFKRILPFFRRGASEPSFSGYLSYDRIYSAGDQSLQRVTVLSY